MGAQLLSVHPESMENGTKDEISSLFVLERNKSQDGSFD
jgi:hypothetical protein